jgi:hypothetical protein
MQNSKVGNIKVATTIIHDVNVDREGIPELQLANCHS